MATKKKAVEAREPRPYGVGDSVFIRAVTNYYTGRIVYRDDKIILLDDAAWIADTGLFSKALETGALNEVEPYPSGNYVEVSVGAYVDLCCWPHPLPRTWK